MDQRDDIIIVTGAAGFIGSCLCGNLNENGFDKIIVVDDFSRPDKEANLKGKKFLEKVERKVFFEWLNNTKHRISSIYHLGARTDTTEFNYSIHQHLNV